MSTVISILNTSLQIYRSLGVRYFTSFQHNSQLRPMCQNRILFWRERKTERGREDGKEVRLDHTVFVKAATCPWCNQTALWICQLFFPLSIPHCSSPASSCHKCASLGGGGSEPELNYKPQNTFTFNSGLSLRIAKYRTFIFKLTFIHIGNNKPGF